MEPTEKNLFELSGKISIDGIGELMQSVKSLNAELLKTVELLNQIDGASKTFDESNVSFICFNDGDSIYVEADDFDCSDITDPMVYFYKGKEAVAVVPRCNIKYILRESKGKTE